MIYTFYSYKGGVGRSMALANVAECMYRHGARVLIVDWDLEAPGLENFFFESPAQLLDVRSQLGVIDMLLDYKRQHSSASATLSTHTREKQSTARMTPEVSAAEKQSSSAVGHAPAREIFSQVKPSLLSLESLLYPIHPPDPPEDRNAGALWLLPPGWRATAGTTISEGGQNKLNEERFSRYAEAVQSFDWADFYANFEGEAYFNWFREQLRSSSDALSIRGEINRLNIDAVLIDSRTGVTEMGGVCTRQLADVIVSFCAPNFQNLDGVVQMSQSFQRDDLRAIRGGRLPEVVVVPARVDLASETDAQNTFHALFDERLKAPSILENLGIRMWDLLIPYVGKYAYRERLTVGARDSNELLEKAYLGLTTGLVLFSDEKSRLRSYFAKEILKLQGTTDMPGVSPSAPSAEELLHKASLAFASFSATEQLAAKRVLTRLVTVASDGGNDMLLRARLWGLQTGDVFVAKRLAAAGILRVSTVGQEEMIEIADPAFLEKWTLLRERLQRDRDFLLWRQGLRPSFEAWDQSYHSKAALLPKAACKEAAEWMAHRREDLTESEREFIEASKEQNKSFLAKHISDLGEVFFDLIDVPRAIWPPVFLLVTVLIIGTTIWVGRFHSKDILARFSMPLTFLYGFVGGLFMTVIDLYSSLLISIHSTERYVSGMAVSWLSSIILSLLGGGLAYLFQTGCEHMSPLLAGYIGAGTPLVFRQLGLLASSQAIQFKPKSP
jgi:hypothetical protein